ncbi:MAG: hypothetical protein EBT10_05055 [Methylocystaceae bacterium]|nr:hypothetical protein [Methylocystaceae bacterium]
MNFDFLTFCDAALYLVQRSKISCFVALLGRFLPRLGPLVFWRPFFFFFPAVCLMLFQVKLALAQYPASSPWRGGKSKSVS